MRKPKLHTRFQRHYSFSLIPRFEWNRLRWKDKFETPRCEREPGFMFSWLGFVFGGWFEDDQYWEQWLWINEYQDGDEDEAKRTWGWVDGDTKESTWIDY